MKEPKKKVIRVKTPTSRITPRRNRDGKITSWELDLGMIGGKRVRRAFRTKAEAEAFAGTVKSARKQYGSSVLSALLEEMPDIAACREMLEPHGVTLKDAMEFALKHLDELKEKKSR